MDFKEWLLNETKKKEHSFSSTQIDFNDHDRKKILSWSRRNIPHSKLVFNDNAEGRETNTHVTVLYGLHAIKPQEVKKTVKSIKPFHIRLGKISKFEGPDYDVIKIDIVSTDLIKANKVLAKLPHTNKYKTYVPHCTIAYVKKGSCDHLLGKEVFKGLVIPVNAITFSSKTREKTTIKLSQ
jgi:2'-5' RNA ligase